MSLYYQNKTILSNKLKYLKDSQFERIWDFLFGEPFGV